MTHQIKSVETLREKLEKLSKIMNIFREYMHLRSQITKVTFRDEGILKQISLEFRLKKIVMGKKRFFDFEKRFLTFVLIFF